MGNSQHLKKALLYFVVVAHWAIIFGNVTAFCLLPFYASWYVALPVMSYIGLLTFSRVLDCPLTRLENRIRRDLNLPEVKGFIGHYLIKPYVRFKRSRRKKKNVENLINLPEIPSLDTIKTKAPNKQLRTKASLDHPDIR